MCWLTLPPELIAEADPPLCLTAQDAAKAAIVQQRSMAKQDHKDQAALSEAVEAAKANPSAEGARKRVSFA